MTAKRYFEAKNNLYGKLCNLPNPPRVVVTEPAAQYPPEPGETQDTAIVIDTDTDAICFRNRMGFGQNSLK